MLPADETLLQALTNLSKDQIRQAGHRYSPGIDPRSPNLRIESLFTALDNIACGAGALRRFQSILDALSEAWDNAKNCSQNRDLIEARAISTRASLTALMVRMRACDAGAGDEWSNHLSGLESGLSADMAHWRSEEGKLKSAHERSGYSSTENTIRNNMNSIGRCLAILREELAFTQSSAFKVLFDPRLLVSGEWGTGKTHLLCDVTQDRISRNQPTVLILAKNFRGNVAVEICARIEAGRTAVAVFDRLEELGKNTNERAIVILDGVNEGPRLEWRKAIASLHALVADRPNIGLIVTCRTPFEPIAC